MLVDDDEGVRQLIVAMLGRIPEFECAGTFADAEGALAAISSQPPKLVVMDIGLPGMNGITCTEQIKIRWPEVCVVVLTGNLDPQVLFEALQAGADGFLYKPFHFADLKKTLRESLDGQFPLAAEARRLLVENYRQDKSSAPGENSLSARELELMQCVRVGRRDKDIAQLLGITLRTVQTHMHHIFKKLKARNRQEAIFRLWGGGQHWPPTAQEQTAPAVSFAKPSPPAPLGPPP